MSQIQNCINRVSARLSIPAQNCFVMVSSVAALGLLVVSPAIAQSFETETNDPSNTHQLADAHSETPVPDTEAPDTEIPDSELDVSIAKDSLRLTPLFRVGANTESGGIPASLTAFDGFFPLRQTPGHNVTYLNTRLNIDFDDDATLGGTLLLGHRSYSSERERILGGYLSLDVRDTDQATFPQIGFGFERLGNYWDIRANGYVPVGDTRQRIDRDIFTSTNSTTDLGDTAFNGNQLSSTLTTTTTDVFTQVDRFEAALGGFDVEAGTRLARWNDRGELRLYGGVYYLAGHDVSAVGGRGRIEIAPVESIRLMAGVQGDPVFDVRGFFGASFLFPTPAPLTAEVDPDEREEAIDALGETVTRLADPVARDFNVVVDEQRDVESSTTVTTTVEEVPFVNPATGEPWRFTHVATGGSSDGTFEDPFGLLQEGLDATVGDGNDIVYVALSDDAEVDPFVAPDNVQVLSTGPEQELDATLAGTTITSVVLPGSNDGNFPDVTDTLTAGSDSKLSGFDITGTTGSAVVVPTGTTGAVEISDNTLTSPAGDGVEIEDISGDLDLLFARNTISSVFDNGIDIGTVSGTNTTIEISDNDLSDLQGAGDGVRVGEITGELDLLIAQNTIGSVGNTGIDIGPVSGTNTTIEISDNDLSNLQGGGDGIQVGEITGDLELLIARNNLSGFGDGSLSGDYFDDNGIEVLGISGTSTANIEITDNEIGSPNTVGNDNAGEPDGIQIGEITGDTLVNVTIDGNTISGGQYEGINFASISDAPIAISGNAEVNISITNNIIDGVESDGILIENIEGNAVVTASITGNTVSSAGSDGIEFDDIEGAATAVITVSDNSISDSGQQGVGVDDIENSAIADITIANNIISRSGGDGIEFDNIRDSADLTLSITGNQISESNNFGIQLDLLEDTSTATINISGNTVDGTGNDGINVDIVDNATVDITVSNNTVQNTGTEGIDIDNDSPNTTITANGNILSDNGESGLLVENQTNGSTCLLLDGNTGNNATVADFELVNDNAVADFEIVDLANVTLNNSGTFDPVNPAATANFTDVASCAP
ncbi:MAG: right-handed parallel beta-helix repeat-containing protein [Cyanobacteria bacterium J06597_1]